MKEDVSRTELIKANKFARMHGFKDAKEPLKICRLMGKYRQHLISAFESGRDGSDFYVNPDWFAARCSVGDDFSMPHDYDQEPFITIASKMPKFKKQPKIKT